MKKKQAKNRKILIAKASNTEDDKDEKCTLKQMNMY